MGKIEGNIVGLPSPRSDWEQTNENKADYIKNKPEIVTSITKVATDKQIPSAKAVYEAMQSGIEPPDLSDYATKKEVTEKADKTVVENLADDLRWFRDEHSADMRDLGDEIDNIETTLDTILAPPIKVFPTTLSPNKSYNFSEAPSKIEFPTVANDGDVIYLTFMVGNESPTIEFITTNTSDYELIPEINTGYEIYAKFNGTVWIVGYSEYSIPEDDA